VADNDTKIQDSLDNAINQAQPITTVLGVVFLIDSALQAFGLVEAGVPAWLNIGISFAVLALARQLPRKSLLLTGVLAAIFLIILVDTLAATGYVLEAWGVLPTILVVIRYLVLLGAAQALVAVIKELVAERQTAERLEKIKSNTVTSAEGTALNLPIAGAMDATDGQPIIDVSKHAAATGIRIMSGLLLVAGLIFGAAMASFGETGVALFGFVLMPLMAAAAFYVAGIEERFIPGLIANVRLSLNEGNTEAATEARTKLVAIKGHASRRLAAAIVNDRVPVTSDFGQEALAIIAEIGVLDADAAFALRRYIGSEVTFPDELNRVLGAGSQCNDAAVDAN